MNEGFKALPEYVQRKIDPEAAKKFYGGGSVMDRPLFRQMGGPAAPPMMGMAPPQVNPEQVAQVQGMEDLAMGQGEQLGQAYASEMITNIDAADDAKDLIDAFRGNEKPLEARYAELAGYVGEADANRTPESVLAMVQPTIMMTEEGAVDSGIGELMQALVQDVGMAEGEQMSQGVGELMAMGAGNTPPVNFNQGGPVMVRKLQTGGPLTQPPVASDILSINPFLDRAMQARQNILGTPQERAAQLEEQKRLTQAQMLFDIAQAGLQFAGSTDGRSVAERLANALAESQLAPKIGQRAAQFQQMKDVQKQQDQQLKLSALESAERSLGAAEQREQEIKLRGIDAANDMAKLLQQQSFTAGENQSERDLRTNLANLQIDAARSLKVLEGEIGQEAIAARAAAAKDLADFNNKFRLKLQDDNFNFQERMATSAQEDRLALEDRRAENEVKLTALKFDNSKESLELQNKYQQENLRISSALSLSRDLNKMEVANAYDLAKIADAQTFDLEKTKLIAELDRIKQEDQQAFTAGQAALNRMLTRSEGAKDRTFKEQQDDFNRELQIELKNMGLNDAQAARAQQQAQFMIQTAQAEHRLMQTDEQLSLARAKEIFDQFATNRQLEIDDYKAKAAAAEITNDNNLLDYIVQNAAAYGDGSLADSNTFENRVLKYTKKTKGLDPTTGKQYTTGNTLSAQVLNEIRERSPDLYYQVTGEEPPRQLPPGQTYFNIPQAKGELFNAQGMVIRNHPTFVNSPTTLFKPDVDYKVVIGASRIAPQVRTAIAEGLDEFSDNEGNVYAGEEAANVKQAVSDLDNISIILNQFLTSGREDRVLKSVQDEINKFLARIQPGGVFFKTDADAASAFKALTDQVVLQMEVDRNLLPDYGGTEGAYFGSAKQEGARLRMINAKPLLNELLKFESAFRTRSAPLVRNPASDEDTASDVRALGGKVN
tara:strand:+ start:201 stop:3035 length:2835 start_codon:yes stop_codon:yes gene_type:complete